MQSFRNIGTHWPLTTQVKLQQGQGHIYFTLVYVIARVGYYEQGKRSNYRGWKDLFDICW